ncbi:MAG: hypothetical protein CMJ54_04490 [Planctomycetaceae bacterium]|nr:hypothetical protein [Planctomycetaceae bacterium]
MNEVRPGPPAQFHGQMIWSLVVAVGSAAVVMSTGCQKLLFKPEDPRTQFEVHDRMRQRYIPIEEEDVFGEPQPALRARLSPDT